MLADVREAMYRVAEGSRRLRRLKDKSPVAQGSVVLRYIGRRLGRLIKYQPLLARLSSVKRSIVWQRKAADYTD